MKKILPYFFTATLILLSMTLAVAQELTHSFSFKDGEAIDDVTGSEGILMGEAYVDGTDLILPDITSYLDLSELGIDINTYDALTLEIWVTPEEAANEGYSMVCYLGGTNAGGLGSQGCFISASRGDDVSRGAISTVNIDAPYGAAETGVNGPEYDDGVQHVFVMTIDDTVLKFYVDGEFMGEAELAEVGNSIPGLSNDFAYVGKGGYTADPCWIGTVHKFNIYNGVLDEGQVAGLTVDPNVTTGIEKVTTNFQPKVYASENAINISMSNSIYSNAKAEVFNLSGQKVAVSQIGNNGTLEVKSGMYIVKVSAESKVYTQKVRVR